MSIVSESGTLVGDHFELTEAEYAANLMKATRSLGVPPKYNMDIDIQYFDEMAPGCGRVYGKTILSNPTVISICPGKVTMLPNFNSDKRDKIFDSIKEAARNNEAILYKVMNENDSSWTAKLFTFESNTEEYAKYLNVLCRASAILMGVGDENMPNTGIKLKNFDYAYWKIRNNYVDTKDAKLRSIWTDFYSGAIASASGAISDDNYVHFFVNNQETQISESIGTETSAAMVLPTAAENLGNLSANLNYYLSGNKSGLFDSTAEADMEKIVATLAGQNETFATIGSNLLNGGQLVFPDMLSGARYSKEIRISMDFISAYGDPLSIFLQCNIPAMHLLAFSLPKQISDNMYTFPFVVRVYQQGMFNADLAVITSCDLNRGGDDGTAWTVDGLSTAWNVTITVTPLYSNLMMTNSDHPFMFIKNESLLEYLGNLCGLDLKANNFDRKLELMYFFTYNRIVDIPSSFGRKIGDSLTNRISQSWFGRLFKIVG